MNVRIEGQVQGCGFRDFAVREANARKLRGWIRNRSDGSVEALARYFEYWLLRLEGVYPSLDQCARCLRPALDAGAVLAAGDWTYICVDCAGTDPELSASAIKFLRQVIAKTPADITSVAASAKAVREVERVHQRLITVHLDKELRSTRVVRELRPQS